MIREGTADEYVAERVREALALDGRAVAQGIDVRVRGDVVVLSGTVHSPEQREAAATVAREHSGGRIVENDLGVVDSEEGGAAEDLGADT